MDEPDKQSAADALIERLAGDLGPHDARSAASLCRWYSWSLLGLLMPTVLGPLGVLVAALLGAAVVYKLYVARGTVPTRLMPQVTVAWPVGQAILIALYAPDLPTFDALWSVVYAASVVAVLYLGTRVLDAWRIDDLPRRLRFYIFLGGVPLLTLYIGKLIMLLRLPADQTGVVIEFTGTTGTILATIEVLGILSLFVAAIEQIIGLSIARNWWKLMLVMLQSKKK